jgi:hypothetical protein
MEDAETKFSRKDVFSVLFQRERESASEKGQVFSVCAHCPLNE